MELPVYPCLAGGECIYHDGSRTHCNVCGLSEQVQSESVEVSESAKRFRTYIADFGCFTVLVNEIDKYEALDYLQRWVGCLADSLRVSNLKLHSEQRSSNRALIWGVFSGSLQDKAPLNRFA